MTRRRLVLYLLLNALVSALVTGAILFFYDHANQKTNCGTSDPGPTLASGDIKVEIINVTGTGVLASEAIIIQNKGEAALLLTGWMLKDSQGGIFTFPQLTLYPGGIVQVHTGTGTNTAADLYWQGSVAVWKSGELVALYDIHSIARAFYRVP